MAPTRLEDINTDTLTAILHDAAVLPDGRIIAMRSEALNDTKGVMSGAARITIEYDSPAVCAPRTLIAKYAAVDPDLLAINNTLNLYLREVEFYRSLANQVNLPTPRCYYAHYNAASGGFLLLLEDLVAANNGSRVAGCSLAQARHIMAEMARLHAAWWQDPRLSSLEWLQPFDPHSLQQTYLRAWDIFVARMGSRLSDELRVIGELLGSRLATLFERYWEAPWTLVHNDFQLDNVFFSTDDATPSLTIIDWQSVIRAQGALDVAGFIGGNLSIADRRRYETELLRLYHQRLIALGVRGFSFDECWRGYQAAMFDGFSRMVIAVATLHDPEKERIHRDILWPRYSAAVLDLRADRLLRQLT